MSAQLLIAVTVTFALILAMILLDTEYPVPPKAPQESPTPQRMMTALTCVVAFTGLVSAIISGGQLSAMQGQVDEMRAQQRPWVFAEKPKFVKPITRNSAGVWEVTIEFELQNIGHLPAMNAVPIVQSPMPTYNDGDIIEKFQNKQCKERSDGAWLVTGETIFPSQKVKRPITIGIWPEDRAIALAKINHVDPWIIGCIAYLAPDKTVHFTRFAYIVSQEDDGYRTKWLPIDDGSVPPDRIRVEPISAKGSFAAD